MNFRVLPLALATLLCLSACETMQGWGDDISSGFDTLGEKVASLTDPITTAKAERHNLPVYDGSCPSVSVRPDLAHLTEFQKPESTAESTKVSEVDIMGVQNTCRVEGDHLVMQIDISLIGKTGPKARARATDKPSFAYPYFIAVTDEQGNVVSKEIFAVSLAYTAEQKDINQTESVFQSMPFPDTGAGKSYQVVLGFQLSDDQLAYNQRLAQAAPAAH
ncbi:MAG: hypothetical protein DI551_06000 [Micavibrio aeruginosavorus]|uniref:Uncharacterized protein n=1 Tax=Micavibrio aeruginosavorus TaxID=349221 RepID=A0A2W5N0S9_9BACT|nr:MAG: hypothetical protein DI551_06000 [Micavibrio aeruginosavorus]